MATYLDDQAIKHASGSGAMGGGLLAGVGRVACKGDFIAFCMYIHYYKIMKVVDIEWDNGNWPKCGKHGVSKKEIEFVLRNIEFHIPDPNPSEKRYRTALQTFTMRYVFVVYLHKEQNKKLYLRPISARYMHKKEIDFYEKIKKTMANIN